MGAFGGMTLTNKGIALQAKAQAGAELHYTRVAIGDGNLGGQSIATLTSLISEKKSLDITKLRVLGNGKAVVGTVFTNQDIVTGFYFREIGIFALDPDEGEVLYAYANAGTNAEYIPPGGGPDVLEKHIDSIVVVGQASNVTATIDQSLVFATLKDMNDHRTAEVLDHPDGSVTAAKLAAGSVTDEKIGDRTISDTSAPSGNSGTLTAILGWLANMIKSITGKSNWRTPPATTLETAKAHMDATTGVHGATSAATPNTLVQRDSAGRFKAAAPAEADDVARKAEVDAHVTRTDNPHGTTAEQVGAPSLTITIPSGVSLNTVVTSGFYRLTDYHPDAPPSTSHGQMIVSRGGDTVLQIVTGFNYSHFYMRHGNPPEAGGQGVWQPWRRLWHDGNDGAGSGLDADLLRGMIPTQWKLGHSIAMRDGNGDIEFSQVHAARNNDGVLDGDLWNQMPFEAKTTNNTPPGYAYHREGYQAAAHVLGSDGSFYSVDANGTVRKFWDSENNGPGRIIDLITEPVRITSPLLTHEAQTLNGVALNLHDFRTYLDRSFFTGREVYLEVVAKTSSASVNAQVNLWADGMWEGGGPSQINFTSVNSGRFRTGNIASSIASIFAGKEASIAGAVNNGGTLTVYRARLIIL